MTKVYISWRINFDMVCETLKYSILLFFCFIRSHSTITKQLFKAKETSHKRYRYKVAFLLCFTTEIRLCCFARIFQSFYKYKRHMLVVCFCHYFYRSENCKSHRYIASCRSKAYELLAHFAHSTQLLFTAWTAATLS